MSLSLVRVDDRLIHGQVVLMWSKVRQGDAIILLVDDELGHDEFLKEVFVNAGNAIGKKVYIFTVEHAKKIEQLYQLSVKGVEFGNEIIFGTASKAEGTQKVYNNIYLSQKDFQYCDKLTAKGMKIHFKLIPDEQGLSWESVKNGLLKGE